MLLGLLFDQYLKQYNGISKNFFGGLGSYIYNFKPYYFRIDGAISHVKEASPTTTLFSGTETDDILFTAGRNFIPNEHSRVTASGLLGIPTHKIYTLQYTQFGYGQVGTGIQLDGSYELTHLYGLFYGARYIYYFPRTALNDLDQKYRFTLGNVIDLLISFKKNWDLHGYEFGYTARFNASSHISPSLDDIAAQNNYTRSTFYFVYKYHFLSHNVVNRLLWYISCAFDHKKASYSNKFITTLWASWSIGF